MINIKLLVVAREGMSPPVKTIFGNVQFPRTPVHGTRYFGVDQGHA